MATIRMAIPSLIHHLAPSWPSIIFPLSTSQGPHFSAILVRPVAQVSRVLFLASISSIWSIPSLLDIWGSILRAVPKKKTSHRKKRQRFLAGKALKDVIALNKCSACGNTKRAHLLCPYCVRGMLLHAATCCSMLSREMLIYGRDSRYVAGKRSESNWSGNNVGEGWSMR